VTVSLDPNYDTPFVMASYARELQARAPGWRFVTGRPANIARVLAAFGVVVERGSDGIPDAHSDFIYIIDRHGRLKTTLPLSTHAVADLRATLAQPTP
jgi:protein SCO1/2